MLIRKSINETDTNRKEKQVKITVNYKAIDEIPVQETIERLDIQMFARQVADAQNTMFVETAAQINNLQNIQSDLQAGNSPRVAMEFINLAHIHKAFAEYSTAVAMLNRCLFVVKRYTGTKVEFDSLFTIEA